MIKITTPKYTKAKDEELDYIRKNPNDIDKVMRPHVAAINKLKGVWTGQCCAGHRKHKCDCYVNNGYIVINMDEKAFKKIVVDHDFAFVYRFERHNTCTICFTFGYKMFIKFDTKSSKETHLKMNRLFKRLDRIINKNKDIDSELLSSCILRFKRRKNLKT